MKKRRRRREIEVTRRRKGGIKSGESNLASNQFFICSPQSETLRDVSRSSIEKRRGKKEIQRRYQEERRGIQKERDQSSL